MMATRRHVAAVAARAHAAHAAATAASSSASASAASAAVSSSVAFLLPTSASCASFGVRRLLSTVSRAHARAPLQLHLLSHRHFATNSKEGDAGAGRKFGGEDKANSASDKKAADGEQKQEKKEGEESAEGAEGEGAGFQEQADPNEGATPAQVIAGLAILFGGAFGLALAAYIVAKAAPTDEQLAEARESGREVSFWGNVKTMVYGLQPLLPREATDAMGRRPRTLVLGWDKVLVHCEWSRQEGWKVRKRPGVDKFLERCQRAGFEVVLWANMAAFEIEALVAELDRTGTFKHKLYNEQASFKWVSEQDAAARDKIMVAELQKAAQEVGVKTADAAAAVKTTTTTTTDQPSTAAASASAATPQKPKSSFQLVRDLNRLQRDPKRLLVLDTTAATYAPIEGKSNVLYVAPFEDDLADQTLKHLGDLVENIQRYNIHDVSTVVAKFNALPPKAKNDPNTPQDLFAEQRRKEQEAMRKLHRNAKPGTAGAKAAAAAAQKRAHDDDDDDDEEEEEHKKSGGGWMSSLRGLVGKK